jgi:hypothetical protein
MALRAADLRRADVIWHLAVSYQALVESGAPGDLLAGVAYWLRRTCREGVSEEDLAHVLEALGTLPMVRKPPA